MEQLDCLKMLMLFEDGPWQDLEMMQEPKPDERYHGDAKRV